MSLFSRFEQLGLVYRAAYLSHMDTDRLRRDRQFGLCAFLFTWAFERAGAPRGYRIAAGRSAVTRRAASLLAEDVDALEEAWEKAGLRGADRTVKVQAPGPITLAAHLELSNGHRAITDAGAVRCAQNHRATQSPLRPIA